jgi:hypothetical protein
MISGCSKDWLDLRSVSSVDTDILFESPKNALMAINGMHRRMHHSSGTAAQGGYETWMIWMEMMGENLVYTYSNAQWQSQARWSLHRNIGSSILLYHYRFFYYQIANANRIIKKVDAMTVPDAEIPLLNEIKGQALAYRAFSYHNLVQAWAERYDFAGNNTQPGVILRDSISYDTRGRSSVEDVYKLINDDLDEAILLLGNAKVRNNKSHINLHVAQGLKARVLLTQGKWREAAEVAKMVVDKSGAKLQDDTYTTTTDRMLDAKNTEFLWCKMRNEEQAGSLTTFEAFMTNRNASYNGNTPRAIYNKLYDRISDTDIRKNLWFPKAQDPKSQPRPVYSSGGGKRMVNYMANKFLMSDPTKLCADVPYMRLPEMMLIMAEGYARAGDTQKAVDALYPLAKHRDPKYTKSTKTGKDLIDEVMFQRSIELWGEGFRFLDLKRLNMDLDRGKKVRTELGYSDAPWKAITPSSTKSTMPKNFDPEASNFNMYDSGAVIYEDARFVPAGDKRWQFLFPDNETDLNPEFEQNEL